MINKVIKRDGRVVDFDSSKILAAVEKSMKAAGQAAPQGAAAVTEAVVRYLDPRGKHQPDEDHRRNHPCGCPPERR